MCGIVACAGYVPGDVAVAMRDKLCHRGPDACGLAAWPDAVLAHRRLSIIDVEGGHQPMANEDESVWVTFNGEIYNYPDLRKELEALGHRFKTRSDTEVLVHLYEERGPGSVERLRGDFALAVWDRRSKEMFLARDRMGVKPLYYAILGETLLAASEIKALLAHPGVSRTLDPVALDQYLSYLYVPTPRTIYAQIRQLAPAHRMRFSGGRAEIDCYWRPPLGADGSPRTLAEVLPVVRDALDDAVRVRLMSEVPLGAFLSGGIDSSSIVAAMARASGRPVRTFTIRFPRENRLYDEGPSALRVARHLHTEHTVLEAKADCGECLDALVEGFDQPFGNPTALLVYALSQLTRRYVTVALAGDGGDELFGGYPRYRGLLWLHRYQRVPGVVRRAVAGAAARFLRDRLDGRHGARRAREFLQGGRHAPWQGYLEWIGWWEGFEKAGLYTEDFLRRLGDVDRGDWLSSAVPELPRADLLASASALDMATFLPENLLAYTDRMSMAHSLEVRVPLTDHLLVEKVLPLSAGVKWPHGRLKGLLRAAVADRLPAETLHGAKVGFNPPMAAWLRGRLAPLVERYLSPESIRRRGIVRPQQVDRLKGLLESGTRDVALHLWALIVMECWMRKSLD